MDTGIDSGVDTGSSDSESTSMSLGSPVVPDTYQDSMLSCPEEEPRAVFGLNQSLGSLALQKLRESGLASASNQPFSSDLRSSLRNSINANNAANNSYEQHTHTSKIRPGTITQRKLSSICRRSIIYPKAANIIGERKLRNAANSDNLYTVMQLLEDGIDPCAADERLRSPLHFAACKGYTSIAQLLINHGADTNQRDVVGNSPLHLAACTGDVAMVTLLLRSGTDVNALDNSGRTPIHLAQSKLKLLQNNSNYSSNQVKNEVLQIIEMMHVFLQRSGKCEQIDILNIFSSRLQNHQTREEVDSDVKELLFNLTHLSLQ